MLQTSEIASNKHKSYQRSRVTNYNSAVNRKAVNYANQINDIVGSDNTPQINSRFLTPKDMEVFVLQVNEKNKFLSLIQLCERTMDYGPTQFLEAIYQERVSKGDLAACEIKGIPYVMTHADPGELDLTNVAAVNRPAALQTHGNKEKLHGKEKLQLKINRGANANRMLQLLAPDLKDQVVSHFPNLDNEPDVIALGDRIKAVYDLEHFAGRMEDLEQQVEEAMADFYKGLVAFESYTKHGTLDLPQHKRIFNQLLSYGKVAGLDELSEATKAKKFLFSCASIPYFRNVIEQIKSNEVQYTKMPKRTEAQREEANKFRMLPLTLQAAYDKLASTKDIGLVYKDEMTSILKNNVSGIQKSNVQSEDTRVKRAEHTSNKKECQLCGDKNKGTHTLLECKFLPNAILALKKEQSANQKKKEKNTETTKPVEIQKMNKLLEVDDEHYSSEDESHLLQHLKWNGSFNHA